MNLKKIATVGEAIDALSVFDRELPLAVAVQHQNEDVELNLSLDILDIQQSEDDDCIELMCLVDSEVEFEPDFDGDEEEAS